MSSVTARATGIAVGIGPDVEAAWVYTGWYSASCGNCGVREDHIAGLHGIVGGGRSRRRPRQFEADLRFTGCASNGQPVRAGASEDAFEVPGGIGLDLGGNGSPSRIRGALRAPLRRDGDVGSARMCAIVRRVKRRGCAKPIAKDTEKGND